MSLGRISLSLSASVFGAFGLAFLSSPTTMAGRVDITLPTPTAIIDCQAIYGGLEIGLAVFFAYCAAVNRWLHPALLVQTLSLGCSALGRLVGILQAGSAQPLIYWLLVAELSGSALGVFTLKREAASQDRNL
jgi:Domain of unknown function (DUF4345)